MTDLALAGVSCQVCAAQDLHEIPGFDRLPRVTSDAKTWPAGGRLCVCETCGTGQKRVDRDWLADIEAIYGRYAIYHQAGGAEQPILTGQGAPRARSELIADFIETHVPVPHDGKLLDFGCGSGNALRTFSGRNPGWHLYGSELSDGARTCLEQLPNFVELFVGPSVVTDTKFDLVTMIHSLEHVIAPADVLASLRTLIGSTGHVLVEVPNCAATPYDLVIADHLTHFTLPALRHVAGRAGFSTLSASDAVLPKELTWVGGRAGAQELTALDDAQARSRRVYAHVDWLIAQLASARSIARESQCFGVFGTSISATWLAGGLGDLVAFFVDEDVSRIGREHMGKPILSPDEAPANSDIYVPLIPGVARRVVSRWNNGHRRLHQPPELLD